MLPYKAPTQDFEFLLRDVFDMESFWTSMEGTEQFTVDDALLIYDEAARFVTNTLLPLNCNGDEEGCRLEDDGVKTPRGWADAYREYCANGWQGMPASPQYGGQGFPKTLSLGAEEMLMTVNPSFALYHFLTAGTIVLLTEHGSESIRNTYLPQLAQGRWVGTMCMTEAQSGTDLGLIKTRAEALDDGTYRITGSKIFISGGDHDMAENHCHLVLAKLPDAPAGSRGISLFLVPKIVPGAEGAAGESNAVSVGSIEKKMGMKANATCVMNFDGATGWLINSPNSGLASMFTMMNYERLVCGLQGLGAGIAAYQGALAYVKERRQGRAPGGAQDPEQVADPILVFGDVRRTLLEMKAFTEGGRALCYYTAMQLDTCKFSSDTDAKQLAQGLCDLLTPVVKVYLSDRGYHYAGEGQQLYGGHGYIREYGMEQVVRDCRIARLYEGANGVIATDLTKRKIVGSNGKLAELFAREVHSFVDALPDNSPATEYREEFLQLTEKVESVNAALVDRAKDSPDLVGAVATPVCHLFGLWALAYMWMRMADAAGNTNQGSDFIGGKLKTARFFFSFCLPEADLLVARFNAGCSIPMSLTEAEF
ncbi:MAG: alkylation response protein AidB-like acyl-CoA dehydrogenase [Halieaceae bacterium]|jgi:alkylation response protein AidB-like acyl-CoA dehydrogenase